MGEKTRKEKLYNYFIYLYELKELRDTIKYLQENYDTSKPIEYKTLDESVNKQVIKKFDNIFYQINEKKFILIVSLITCINECFKKNKTLMLNTDQIAESLLADFDIKGKDKNRIINFLGISHTFYKIRNSNIIDRYLIEYNYATKYNKLNLPNIHIQSIMEEIYLRDKEEVEFTETAIKKCSNFIETLLDLKEDLTSKQNNGSDYTYRNYEKEYGISSYISEVYVNIKTLKKYLKINIEKINKNNIKINTKYLKELYFQSQEEIKIQEEILKEYKINYAGEMKLIRINKLDLNQTKAMNKITIYLNESITDKIKEQLSELPFKENMAILEQRVSRRKREIGPKPKHEDLDNQDLNNEDSDNEDLDNQDLSNEDLNNEKLSREETKQMLKTFRIGGRYISLYLNAQFVLASYSDGISLDEDTIESLMDEYSAYFKILVKLKYIYGISYDRNNGKYYFDVL